MNGNLVIKGFNLGLDYLNQNSPKNGRISFLSLETEPICNAKCLYCFSGPELGKIPEDVLTLKEYKDIINQAKDLGAKTIAFLGVGESTLDKKLPDLIQFDYNNNLTSVVYTNLLFNPKLIDFFYNHNTSLLVKIDTFDLENYNKLIGNSFTKFKQNLNEILRIYNPIDNKSNITRVGACTVITNLNKKDVQEIDHFCEKYKIKHFVGGLAKVGWAKDNWEILIGDNKEELDNIVAKYNTFVSSQTIDNRCGLFAYGITIDVNGDLIGCSTARWLRLGNVREKSLKELINIYKEKIWNDKSNYCLGRELSLRV